MTMSDNPIEKIRARLDGGNKWCKNQLGDVAGDGPVCLVGAVMSVGAFDGSLDVIGAIAAEQFPERARAVYYGDEPVQFNNHPDTTWGDMELVLDKASLRWEETVQ